MARPPSISFVCSARTQTQSTPLSFGRTSRRKHRYHPMMSVLKSCSALEAYRKIYVGQVAPWKVAEFLIAHPEFPRSIRFSVDSLDAALHRISGSPETNYANEAERLSGRLRYDLDFATIADIFDYGLHEYLILTQKRLAEISRALFEIYCATNETISPPSIAEGRTA